MEDNGNNYMRYWTSVGGTGTSLTFTLWWD